MINASQAVGDLRGTGIFYALELVSEVLVEAWEKLGRERVLAKT